MESSKSETTKKLQNVRVSIRNVCVGDILTEFNENVNVAEKRRLRRYRSSPAVDAIAFVVAPHFLSRSFRLYSLCIIIYFFSPLEFPSRDGGSLNNDRGPRATDSGGAAADRENESIITKTVALRLRK